MARNRDDRHALEQIHSKMSLARLHVLESRVVLLIAAGSSARGRLPPESGAAPARSAGTPFEPRVARQNQPSVAAAAPLAAPGRASFFPTAGRDHAGWSRD